MFSTEDGMRGGGEEEESLRAACTWKRVKGMHTLHPIGEMNVRPASFFVYQNCANIAHSHLTLMAAVPNWWTYSTLPPKQQEVREASCSEVCKIFGAFNHSPILSKLPTVG